MAVNPPANMPSTKSNRQIQASTPVTAATPPHTPAIHLSPSDRRSRLIASDGPDERRRAAQHAGLRRLVLGRRECAALQQAMQLLEFVRH